jgi:hypothetical protein
MVSVDRFLAKMDRAARSVTRVTDAFTRMFYRWNQCRMRR